MINDFYLYLSAAIWTLNAPMFAPISKNYDYDNTRGVTNTNVFVRVLQPEKLFFFTFKR